MQEVMVSVICARRGRSASINDIYRNPLVLGGKNGGCSNVFGVPAILQVIVSKEYRSISEQGMRLNDGQTPKVSIRRATSDDIESLVKICRENLPGFMMWCTRRRARRWWREIITSSCHETWVGDVDNEIVALIRLVTDADQYWKDIEKFKPGFGVMFFALACRPQLLFSKICEQLYRIFAVSEDYCQGDDCDNITNKTAWAHSIVVVEKMRGRGIASEMVRFCERRGTDLGYDTLKCFVKTNNKSSIRLHERLGFVRAKKVKDHYLYIKNLREDQNAQTDISENKVLLIGLFQR